MLNQLDDLAHVLNDFSIYAKSVVRQLTNLKGPTYAQFAIPLEKLKDEHKNILAPIQYLKKVLSTPKIEAAVKLLEKEQSSDPLGLHEHSLLIYDQYCKIINDITFVDLKIPEKQLIENELVALELSGIRLGPEKIAQYQALKKQLIGLYRQFQENITNCLQNWSHTITDENELKGLPSDMVEEAYRAALLLKEKEGISLNENPDLPLKKEYVFSLNTSTYLRILAYAQHRPLRELFYKAFRTVASTAGSHDPQFNNGPIMVQILTIRHQMATLLGFVSHVEYQLKTRMAKKADEVKQFLEKIHVYAKPSAKAHLFELKKYATTEGILELEPWDLSYYNEIMIQARCSIHSNDIRAYFPIDKVLSGLFKIVNQLYRIEVKERLLSHKERALLWDPKVRLFEVVDAKKQLKGTFYLDLEQRLGKRQGAWCEPFRARSYYPGAEEVQLPMVILNTNFSATSAGEGLFLYHQDVITLFHEFGHGLHVLLSQVNQPSLSTFMGCAWDFIELPSQLMENYAFEPEVLKMISSHKETKLPLSDAICDRLIQSKKIGMGPQVLIQIDRGMFDIQVHEFLQNHDRITEADIHQISQDNAARYNIIPPPPYNHYENCFTHIFNQDLDYSAGYYSYLWANLLSSDCYARLNEGGILNPLAGDKFLKTLLSKGGSENPLFLYQEFMGRRPILDPMLIEFGFKNPEPNKRATL